MDTKEKCRIFRDRFYGRQDVYGKQWELRSKEDGSIRRGYAPVCDNLWKEFCHLKLKDGVPCTNCDHRKWAPVSEASIAAHIHGESNMLNYVLQTDGSIKYGAIDFDMKEGKEDKGYGWDDVKKISDILSEWGVAHANARSTGSGFHTYIFFEEFYPSIKFRSFVLELFDRAGFMQYVQQGIKPLPEFFPKQSYAGRDGIGNGIKPPMIEPRFEKRRNGWVDSYNNFIGQDFPPDAAVEAQWEYFNSIPKMSTEAMDKVIEANSIEILEDIAGGSRSSVQSKVYGGGQNSKWQQPLSGSIEKVLEGCESLRKVRDKALSGGNLGHHEGFGLFHIAIHTQDGRDWFTANVKGWGENQSDIRQLEQSIEKNYSPWTCKKLQEYGVCPINTQCFEKKPPKEIIDGLEVVRNDLPKELWPEPSPIRYAFGKGEDYLSKLKAEVLEAKNIKDPTSKYDAIKDLARRVQVFDEEQQKDFKSFVRENKPLKRNEISKIFNEASDVFEVDLKKKMQSRSDTIAHDDNYYVKDEYGYSYVKQVKDGKPKTIKLCSVDININEIRVYQEEEKITKTVYIGNVRSPGLDRMFEIDTAVWCDNSGFFVFFTNILGADFSPLRQNLEYIRQASLSFSKKNGIERKIYLMTQGYYGNTYLMPSCIVDATGVRPNTTQHVELGFKETRNLDFKMLSDSEFSEVLLHIKSEFLRTWPEDWAMVGLAHTLMPGVLKPLGWSKRPTLFYEGLTGGGKSELTHALQNFWGVFDHIANFMSSPKGVMELGHQFKDACTVVDDFKNLSREQNDAVKKTILHTYDGHVDFKLRRDATFREPRSVRGLYMMSGEEFVTNDAATIARTIIVSTHKHNTKSTQDLYQSVLRMRKHYSGVTARFISWFLGQDFTHINIEHESIRSKLRSDKSDAQNIDRIVNNLSFNVVVWRLFTAFMVESNVMTAGEKENMDDRHWTYMIRLRGELLERCASEQSSEVFLRILSQLLSSGELSIAGMSENPNKPCIGRVPKDCVGIVHLFPDVALEQVKNHSKNAPIFGTGNAILRQLDDLGLIAEKDGGRNTKSIKYQGRVMRVWSLKQSALGVADNDGEKEINGKVIKMHDNIVKGDFSMF